MSDTTPGCRLRRGLVRGAVTLFCIQFGTPPVAAHGGTRAGVGGVDLPVVLAVVTAVGVVTGVVATALSGPNAVGSDLLRRAVGPLLVIIGCWAVVGSALQRPAVTAGGVTLGLVAGLVVAARGGCKQCADLTVGAIAIHRFVEGLLLAGLAVAGASVGVIGTVVLSLHAIIECVAIVGHPTRDSRQAIAAVALVSVAFVLGAVVGVTALSAVEAVPRVWTGGIVGGLLVAVGVTEFRPAPFETLETGSSV